MSVSVVLSFNTGSQAAQDFVRDRADPIRHLTCIDALVALRAEKDDLVARADAVDVGDVDCEHVHADGAHNPCPLAADEDEAVVFETPVKTISVTGGDDS